MAYHGAHIAAHAAAEKRRKLLEAEEQEMTKYTSEELEGNWEFKIVRSESGAFRKPEVLAIMLEEEALAGWEMVEKFDNQRVRLKRRKEAGGRDHLLPPQIDPYRTQYGSSYRHMAVLIGTLFLILGVMAFVFFAFMGGSGGSGDTGGWIFISIIAVFIVMLGIVAASRAASR
jgi:hypothetical protein